MDSDGSGEEVEQLELLDAPARRRPRPAVGPAEVDPVAVVQVDTGLPHLDRPFDYLVPAELDDEVRPGVRVKVRFAGRDLDGWVLERRAEADFTGRLTTIRRVVSPEPVLTPTLLSVCRAVAERSAGTLGDVLRLAVPPRHAAAERALGHDEPDAWSPEMSSDEAAAWTAYVGGTAFLTRLADGQSPAAGLLALPSTEPVASWAGLLLDAAAATLRSGRGVIIVVPDARDVDRVEALAIERWGRGHHVRLTADQGPQARYTAWLKALRGQVRVVIGTRAAVHAPLPDLGLIAWWDDGDASHVEPRAPYAHVHTVALVRADIEDCALLSAGFSRSCAVQQLIEEDRLKPVAGERSVVRVRTPNVRIAGEGADEARDPTGGRARLPTLALESARSALQRGPVLIQVPRRGYVPSLSCQDCRRPVRCSTCAGPVALTGPADPPQCRWCGRMVAAFECPHCGGHRMRSSVVGARRTAEELGRAFPGVPVQTSGGAEILGSVPGTPRLVIATPGAEPVAEGGYAAVLLLDAWALLDRPELTAGEECVRRWLGAAALARARGEHGVVVLCGAPSHVTVPAIESLVRWDPAGFAQRELAERRELRLPPAAAVGVVTGAHGDLMGAVDGVRWPADAALLGPVPVASRGSSWGPRREPDRPLERLVVSAPKSLQGELADVLKGVRARWAASRQGDAVQVRLDPDDPTR